VEPSRVPAAFVKSLAEKTRWGALIQPKRG
jgi:hypothetical protein